MVFLVPRLPITCVTARNLSKLRVNIGDFVVLHFNVGVRHSISGDKADE